MKKRVIFLILLFIFAWTHPISENVEVSVHINKPKTIATSATYAQKQENKAIAMNYARAGWGWDRTQRRCVYLLFMAESKFDHLAKNKQGSSAFGIAQMLKEQSKQPQIQILHAYKYITLRYKTPCRAWSFHKRHGYY